MMDEGECDSLTYATVVGQPVFYCKYTHTQVLRIKTAPFLFLASSTVDPPPPNLSSLKQKGRKKEVAGVKKEKKERLLHFGPHLLAALRVKWGSDP